MIEAYAGLEFAGEFLEMYYGEESKAWSALGEVQRKALLVQATLAIDALGNVKRGFWGRKRDEGQARAFPREGEEGISDRVMMACCLEAWALADAQCRQRRRLRRQGVSAMAIGSASEQYMRFGLFGGNSRSNNKTDISQIIASEEAFGLMMEYLDLRGVYSIN